MYIQLDVQEDINLQEIPPYIPADKSDSLLWATENRQYCIS